MIAEHEPGGFRDRCGRCGGWISLGHAYGSSCRQETSPPAAQSEAERRRINGYYAKGMNYPLDQTGPKQGEQGQNNAKE